jgi:hypothetical protein
MSSTYRFISTVEESLLVLDWFRSLVEKPVESVVTDGSLFYFRDFGPLDSDAKKSPLVAVFQPSRKCGVITTIGEVHFLTKSLASFPALKNINNRFRKWLGDYPCIYSHRADFNHQWDYYLEGTARNWHPDIFALPAGMNALQSGAYFISRNDPVLDQVCRTLELRGIHGVVRDAVEDSAKQ